MKEEITRLAKKEVKTVARPLASQVRALKRAVSQQRRTIARLEKELALKAEKVSGAQITPSGDVAEDTIRVGPRSNRLTSEWISRPRTPGILTSRGIRRLGS